MSAEFRTRVLLGRTLALLRAGASPALPAWLLLAAGGTALDSGALGDDGGDAMTVLLSVASVAFQYWLTRAALPQIGAAPRGHRFGAFFLLYIVSSLAILLGFVLLIVPGILLMVRWWMAGPILLDGDAGVFQSLKQSWRETESRFWPIFLLLGLFWVPIMLAAAALYVAYGEDGGGVAGLLPLNLALYAAMIVSWYLAVAAYSFSESRSEALVEIFA